MLLPALAVCFVAVSAYGEDAVRVETITATLSEGESVSINNINGDISIEGWDSDEVEIVYTVTCDDTDELDAVDVICDLSHGITCEVDYDEDFDGNIHGDVVFHIKVPENQALVYEISDVNGAVNIMAAAGSVDIEVVNGDIEVDEFNGDVSIALVNGSVTTSNIASLEEIAVVNGEINCMIDELGHDVDLNSVNGEITVTLTEDAEIDIETVSGDIDISDAFNARVIHEIASASASFGEGDYSIEISTVSGDIEIFD